MDIVLALALSKHLAIGDYNDIHPHIRFQDESFIAGAYLNSFSTISPYAGFRFEHYDHGFEVGAVGGYPSADIIPYIRYTYDFTEDYRAFVAPVGEVDQYDNFYLGSVIGVEFIFRK